MSPPSVEPRAEDFPRRIRRNPAIRRHRPQRPYHQLGVCHLLPERPAGIAVGPGASGDAAIVAIRVGPAGARLSQGVHWPGAEVGALLQRIGRSSIVLAQALFQNDRCVATAQSVAVLMDTTSRRSQPIPLAAAQNLQAFALRMQRPDRPPDLPPSYFDEGVSLLPRAPADKSSALRPSDDL